MSISLNTIIESSRKGYIDDPETIGRTVNSLLDTSVKKLAVSGGGKYVDSTVKSLTESIGLLNAENYDFTLSDLMCMALRIRDMQRDDYQLFRYAARFGYIISGAAQVSDTARLFMGTSFRAFTEYVGTRSGAERGKHMYNKVFGFLADYFHLVGDEEITMKTVLEISRSIAGAWDWAMPLDQFAKRACAYFHIAEVTVIECMVLCCPEKFRFGALLNSAKLELRPNDVPFDKLLGKMVSGRHSFADIELDWYEGPDLWCCYYDEDAVNEDNDKYFNSLDIDPDDLNADYSGFSYDEDDDELEKDAVEVRKAPEKKVPSPAPASAPKDDSPSWDEVTARLRKIAEEQRKKQSA